MAKMLINGALHDKPAPNDGRFVRLSGGFHNWIERDRKAAFPAQADRYHLYISRACPWCHRATIMRALKGLGHIISITDMAPLMGEESWKVDQEVFDENTGVARDVYMYEVYLRADPHYTGPITVPVLWNKKTGRIVSTESADIMRMLNSAFADIADTATDYYPENLRPEIDRINAYVYENINNGVYRAGFAASQNAYDEAVEKLFTALDDVDHLLAQRRYLTGGQITEADWRLFATLIRFDPVYVTHFKTDHRRISDYAQLGPYLRELYQIPGISETVDMEHIRQHYYRSHKHINPAGIIATGPDLDLDRPHNRGIAAKRVTAAKSILGAVS